MKILEFQNLTKIEISELLRKHYGIAGKLSGLPSYRDQNFLVSINDGSKFIVKFTHIEEDKQEIEMQNAAMAHMIGLGMSVPHAIANKKGQLITVTRKRHNAERFMRVLTYLPGQFFSEIKIKTHTQPIWKQLGEFIANISLSLKEFDHPGVYRYLDWDLASGYRICQNKKKLLSEEGSKLVNHFLGLYHTETQPLLSELPMSVIHNDANDQNLLVDDLDEPGFITGLIDFGDMLYSQTINELAICLAYSLMEQEEPLEVMKLVVKAYHKIKPLQDIELGSLFNLICLRLCTSVCNAALAIREQPGNDYLLVSVKPAWRLLKQLKSLNSFTVLCQLRKACDLPIDPGKSSDEIMEFRQAHLSKNLSVSYNKPLKIVRGFGPYLYDETGTPYIDMVNNVCHVGHCHPTVVMAAQNQLATLNTNTRYLHDNIVNYTTRLLATLPEELSVCMFVNSGSEANELAFRLARNYTGSKELLVVDGAYHGNTNACIEASPYKFNGPGGSGPEEHVHIVKLPDPYRGEVVGDTESSGQFYAKDVALNIEQLNKQNKTLGAFICESLQGVAGQIIMPKGYLSSVYSMVREAGGVCIADEVQVGFGRVGTHMWAFETQGVVPDILTLGKPIGNGHPMAAVVTTKAIADSFVTGMEYFNTFGGNPVSCAVGIAVLDAIETDRLQNNALEIGQYLFNELTKLKQEFELIGDVRGLGLFMGVEFVEDRETKEPAAEKTAWLIEYFKDHHILLTSEGPFYNILKIKPPLAFNRQCADKFLRVLKKGLQLLLEH